MNSRSRPKHNKIQKTSGELLYLKRIQVLVIKFLEGVVKVLVGKTGADLAVDETALNLVPILCFVDPVLQPIGVVAKPVLLITPVGDNLASAFVGNNKSEDSEGEEEDDEDEHDEEVKPEKPRDSAASTDEAGEGDEHEEDPDHDDGHVKELLALGAALPAQPNPCYHDWNRQ